LFRRLSGRRRYPTDRRRPYRPRLALEPLEDRVVPSNTPMVDIGQLRFVAVSPATFETTDGHTYTAEQGSVKLGYKPAANQAFVPLVNIVVNDGQKHFGELTIDLNQAPLQFSMKDTEIDSIVQGGPPTMLWQPPDQTTPVAFKVSDLLGPNGVALNDTNSSTLSVSMFNFTPSSLAFAQPQVGPTAYYSFDKVSGTTVSDTAGMMTPHDGTLANGAQVGTAASFGIPARPGSSAANKVLQLDGNTQFLNVTNSPADLQPKTGPFTVAAWVYVDDPGKEQVIAGEQQQGGATDGWELGVSEDGTDGKLFVRLGEKGQASQFLLVEGDTALKKNTWYHVAFTYSGGSDASSVRIFLDGNDDGQSSHKSTLPLQPDIETQRPVNFTAGALDVPVTSPLAGYLDDVAVWNGVLVPAAVQGLYAGTQAPTDLQADVPGNGQVLLQGKATIASYDFLKALTLNVSGINHVVFDKTGVSLTGLDATVQLPNKTIGGLTLSGTVTVGYTAQPLTLKIGGSIFVSTDPEGPNSTRALDKVGASVNLVVSGGHLTKFGFGLTSTQFNIMALSVQVDPNNPITFEYNVDKSQFEMWGGLKVSVKNDFIKAVFGNSSSPGIVVKNGTLQQLTATVSGNVQILEVQLAIPQPGLTFSYNTMTGRFEMYGGTVSLTAAFKAATLSLQVSFGNKDTPGLVIQQGQLASVNLGVAADFTMENIQFHVGNPPLTVTWATGPDNTDQLTIAGSVSVTVWKFTATVTLGSAGSPGLLIQDGVWSLKDIDIKLQNLPLGAFTISLIEVHYTQSGSSFNLFVDVNLTFPAGFTVCGAVTFKNGAFDALTLGYNAGSSEGIMIGDTGLFLTHIEGTVQNIDTPSTLVVSASADFVYGQKFSIGGTMVSMFRAHGDITVDKDELILNGDAQLGAYQNSDGSWNGVLGTGQINLSLQWNAGLYKAHVAVDGLAGGFFSFQVDFYFAANKDINFLVQGTVQIPSWVPIIGGTKLASVNIFFQYAWAHDGLPSSTTLAAWIELDVIWQIDLGFEIVWDQGGAHFSLIGNAAVAMLKAEAMPPQNNTYTYKYTYDPTKVPAAATALTLGVDWSKTLPGVTIVGTPTIRLERKSDGKMFTEADFTQANNLAPIPSPSSSTFKGVTIVGSNASPYTRITDQYDLYVDITTTGGQPFQSADDLNWTSTVVIPKPTVNALDVPAKPSASFPLVVTGNMDTYFIPNAQVSLYRVLAADPTHQGTLIGTAPVMLDGTDGNTANWKAKFNVPLDGLFPTDYYLYAVVDEQGNSTPDYTDPNQRALRRTPVQSANSTVFEPEYAVHGNISNQNNHPLSNWPVFLDLNQDGILEPWEPVTVTNDQGFYGFLAGQVPVNTEFNVIPVPPATDFDVAPLTDQFYNGNNPVVADFTAKEKSAIRGTIYGDVQGDGSEANSQPLAGVNVYIDANHDGHLDPGDPTTVTDASGNYVFPNLAPGTYTVAVDPTSITSGSPVAAIDIPAGAVGNNPFTGAVGLDFNVNQPITITELGVFDSGQTGLKQPLTAYLYNRVTQQLLAKLVFTPDDPGTLIGGTRFKPLDQPITLPAGFEGTIAADGFGPDQMFESYQPDLPGSGPQPGWSVNDLDGRISFVNGRSGPTAGQFPNFPNAGEPVPYPYEAVSFLVDHPAWFQTGVPPGGTYNVTISSDPYDLKDLIDFSMAPDVPITGRISGHYLDPNGQLQGDTTPLVGWVVQLLDANQQVVATTTTDAAGRYLFNNIKPGQYTVHQVLPAGWRQADPLHADLQFSSSPPGVVNAPQEPTAYMVVGDFNNDGHLDIATIGAISENLNLFIYDPSGDSYIDHVYPLPDKILNLVVGDFGGNHRADLAVLTQQGTLILLLNDGKPGQLSFTEVDLPALPSTVKYIFDMKAGDLNKDGMDDLVLGYQSDLNHGGVAVILDPGDPAKRTITTYPLPDTSGFGASAGFLAIGDVNGDGNLDVVMNGGQLTPDRVNTFSVALGDGQGKLGAWQSYQNPFAPGGKVVLGDVRQNGSLDAVLFNHNSNGYSIDLFLNQGGGVYNQGQHLLGGPDLLPPAAVALADVNGDLRPDLVLLYPGLNDNKHGPYFVVYLNTGTAPYFDVTKPLVFPIPMYAGPDSVGAPFMAIADLNNDGLNDLLALVPSAPPSSIIQRLLNTTQNPPNQAVTLTFGQPLSNGTDFVNAQFPKGNDSVGGPGPKPPPPDNATLYVGDLYRQILERDAEPAGLALWASLLKAGTPRATVVQAIWDSPEHRGLEVDQLYATYLHRAADPQGRASWVNALLHGMTETEASRRFLTSAEYLQAHADPTAYLTGLYADVLGRAPDAAGLAGWQQAAQGGLSRAALADAFLQSPEEAKQLVNEDYNRYLARPADAPGERAWAGALLEHRLTEEQVAQAFLASDEFFARATHVL
jgi:hypothetical protein